MRYRDSNYGKMNIGFGVMLRRGCEFLGIIVWVCDRLWGDGLIIGRWSGMRELGGGEGFVNGRDFFCYRFVSF